MLLYTMAENSMNVPISWVLTSGGALAMAISFLARMLFNSQKAQITALREDMREASRGRDIIIEAQSRTIQALQDDVRSLKQGCGHDQCHFKKRC